VRLARLFLLLILIILLLCSCSLNVYQSTLGPVEEGHIRLHFLDVGQGDSILVQLTGNRTMLVDGGGRDDGRDVVRYIGGLGIKKIDFLVATHPHEDHIGGLADVLKSIDVGRIYMPKVIHTSDTFTRFVNEAVAKGHRFYRARAGMLIIEEEDLRLECLAPVRDSYDSLNNYSAVIKIDYRQVGVLLMGDAEKESEAEINRERLRAQVLKVGHHGSDTSTSAAFLKMVSPRYAVISVGKDNSYGHPHKDTLDLLYENGIQVLRTDDIGTIVIDTDGIGISVKKFK
jgi:competence protein ComEC